MMDEIWWLECEKLALSYADMITVPIPIIEKYSYTH